MPSARGRVRRLHAYTLIELIAALSVMTVAAVVTVPAVGLADGRLAAAASARQLALVLRRAQAEAQADGCRLRVQLTDGGDGYVVQRLAADGTVVEEQGGFGGARCSSNYPAGAVDFTAAGWPLAQGSATPRAGTFSFSPAGGGHAVVLQMGGRIRWQ